MFTAFGPMYQASCALLPPQLDSPQAKAMLMAIAMQESRLDARRQIGGPARGFWQFELGGINGVLKHKASAPYINAVLSRLDYDAQPQTSYTAIEHNDVLAFAYARLLLYTLPQPLPDSAEPDEGWEQYIGGWRPGAPHRATWRGYFDTAWNVVRQT